MYIYIHTLRSGIDVPPSINLSKIFHSGLSYSSHAIYLFMKQISHDNCFFFRFFFIVC